MAYGQGMGGGPDSSGVEGLGADAFGDGNTGGGKDSNAGPEIDQANAISGMANALDNAANAVQSGFDPSAQALGGPAVQSGLAVGPSLGSKSRTDMDTRKGSAFEDHDPATHLDFSTPYGQNVVSPLDQKEAFMGANPSTPSVSLDSLGATPTIGELSAAIGVDPSTLGVTQGFDPSAPPSGAGYGFDSATVEQESPGQEAAAVKNDFEQATQLDPSAAPAGVGTNQNAVEAGYGVAQGANSTGWDGMTEEQKERATNALNFSPNYANIEAYNQYDVPAFNSKMNEFGLTETPAFDPSTSLETAQFDMDALNAHLQSRNTFGLGYDTPGVSTDTTLASWDAKTAPATDPETTPAPKYGPKKGFVDHEKMYPGHAKKAAMSGVANVKSMLDGTHQGWIDDINEDMEKRGIELSHTLDGKAPNGIPFGQEGTNLSGKHSAANWGEYDGMFSPDENGVPVDENGVAMPGTDKQAQKGIAGFLQGIAYGMFSGLVNPDTSSGVVDPTASSGLGLAPVDDTDDDVKGHGYDGISGTSASTSPLAGPGGAEGGDHPVNFMRSIYPWAASLPYSVLFNAAKYPDYLRLLIEADATGTELPMAIPQWILDGKSAPETTNVNLIQNHPAMQAQVT